MQPGDVFMAWYRYFLPLRSHVLGTEWKEIPVPGHKHIARLHKKAPNDQSIVIGRFSCERMDLISLFYLLSEG